LIYYIPSYFLDHSTTLSLEKKTKKVIMAEPLFDPTLKKRKKKTVAFTEDPLGAEADPTAPSPQVIDDTTTEGVGVDMGPKTVHEQLANGAASGAATGEGREKAGEDEEFKAMFGDLKKKKKKKEIPMDFVRPLILTT
jgi:translation initiation factor 2 subunit 2